MHESWVLGLVGIVDMGFVDFLQGLWGVRAEMCMGVGFLVWV